MHHLHLHGHAALQVVGHLVPQLHAILLEKAFLRCVDGEVHRAAVLQKAHVNGAVHQFVRHGQAVLAGVVIPLQQQDAVPVGAGELHHVPGVVQIHLHLGVDGQVDGGVHIHRLVVQGQNDGKHQGCGKRGQPRRPAANPGQQLQLGGGLLQQYRVENGLAHLIAEVGRLDKPPLLVQQDRVTSAAFHHQIAHWASPPSITWAKCPRMISYPLV